MAVIINSNIASLNAQRNLSKTQSALDQALSRLSSGLRVNSAKDDAAGLFTIQQQTADIRGANQAARNAADGISFAQIAEGALGEIANNLQRIRELAVQAANGTVQDRSGLTAEVAQLEAENTRIASMTTFNNITVLDAALSLSVQAGPNNGDTITIDSATYTAPTAADVSSDTAAAAALATLDTDIDNISTLRATFGAVQNRFEAVISNLDNYAENVSAARSRVEDADFAAETAKLTRAQILQQAGIAIATQANAVPQRALAFLN